MTPVANDRPGPRKRRIGLIGFGGIGAQVFDRVRANPSGPLEIAFVHNRSAARMAAVPAALRLNDMADFASFNADLVVEMAHPHYTQVWGEAILSKADYLPLSVSALADDALRERLIAQAQASDTALAIPHGALMGLDSLREWRHQWIDVVISFFKHPRNIDFSESGIDPGSINGDTVLYDGPARGIARLFPRNINTMITCALATTGLDACRARLVAMPGLTVAVAEVSAKGRDGATLTMRKEQPASGVSGSEMFESQFASILRAAGAHEPLTFV